MGDKQLTLTANPVGDNAVIFYLPEPVQDSYPLILHELAEQLKPLGIIDYVIAYHSLLIIFDPKIHSALDFMSLLNDYLPQAIHLASQTGSQRIVRIPVCYEGEFSPDLAEVAERANLTKTEVIKRHSEKIYTVCCLGFIPGFAFLGYVDEAIATPRRAEPRVKIPAGSVGIAGRQTGVYPADSPGGWQIIGCTPMTLYAPERGLYSRFAMGDRVQFYAISRDEFNAWSDDV